MPESLRISPVVTDKPLWQVYYPDRDPLVKARTAQRDTSNQNGIVSKEKSTDDIEVIMLGKQVITYQRFSSILLFDI